jgi:hypothetical protein
MRCWQCGAEPLEVFDVTTLGDAEPRYMPGRWPPGDHEHAVTPPTPAEIAAAGDAALARIVEEWSRMEES